MPYLHNGIGTWYYGKRNVDVHVGPCESCKRTVKLSTYETRLWFVVFLLPVIPLGRKQVFNHCPACTRHRVMPLVKWKQIEAESLRNAMAQAEQNPNDPAAAIHLHATLVGCYHRNEAQRLAEVMLTDFPDDFNVHVHLGNWFTTEGKTEESHQCFVRALELEPENPPVRRVVALGCIDKGELDRARELLRGLDVPGPNQAPLALRALADAYHARDDHQNAMEFYEAALRLAPELAQDKLLRKRIARTEAALGRPTLILPAAAKNRSRYVVIAAIVVVLAVIAAMVVHYLF